MLQPCSASPVSGSDHLAGQGADEYKGESEQGERLADGDLHSASVLEAESIPAFCMNTLVGIPPLQNLVLQGFLTVSLWVPAGLGAPDSASLASPPGENPPGFRRAPLTVVEGGEAGFTALPGTMTGVAFTNHLDEAVYLANINLLNGSGVALGDYDGDGRCDMYLCGLERPSALYRNLGGLRFQDVTAETSTSCTGQRSTGAAFADVDADGDLDLLVNSMGGPNALLVNNGQGAFTNATGPAGLTSKLGSTSLALGDVDGDGDLDLFVANYGVSSILRSGGQLSFRIVNGRRVPAGRNAKRIRIIDDMIFELGEPDVLYLNNGKGKFEAVSWTEGAFLDEEGRRLSEVPYDQSLSVLMHDFTGDGAPDIYVCGDASTPDRFWLNNGQGRFRAASQVAVRQIPYFSMSMVATDVDRDGLDDIFATDMLSRQHVYALTQRGNMHDQPRLPGDVTSRLQQRRNMLLRARGDGTYAEIAWYAGVAGSEWAWSCLGLDVDLDGWEDLLISNGHIHNADDLDTRERIRNLGRLSVAEARKTALLFERLDTANLAYRNLHDLTFAEFGQAWGFDSRRISNGMALGDLDGDGDLDVVINCFGDEALILRNNSTAPRLAVRLRGRAPNSQGIGARIRVSGGPVTQEQEMIAGGRYLSGDQPLRVFATGDAERLTIEVRWRAGHRTVIPNAGPNYLYEIEEPPLPKPMTIPEPEPAHPAPLFAQVGDQLSHRHMETPFDDFAQQPLLPYRLSRLGPGIGWLDLDGDSREELCVPGDTGGSVEVLRYEPARTRFEVIPSVVPPLAGDGVAVAAWVPGSGRRQLLVGLANQEAGSIKAAALVACEWREGQIQVAQELPGDAASTGPVAVTDLEGDGDLDVFVGGRFVPGRYPEPASSRLYRNDQGNLVADLEANRLFENLGLVSGACWADVNGDGFSDLVLACEWEPVRLFLNDQGYLHEATAAWGLADHQGLWTGVTAGDFDGDGRLDLVAGNWGWNSPYRASTPQPLTLIYGDLDLNGVVDLLEAYEVPGIGLAPRRDLDAVAGALPFLRTRFESRRSYAQASIQQILGPERARAKELTATTLASTVFLNRGARFEPLALPPEAQVAPTFGIGAGDLDGDGCQDLFLSQNLHSTQPDFTRMDAGRGLVLLGDGHGHFTPMPGQASGVKLYGEQRGCALADYDADGRTDLVVTQNGAATALFRNQGARPGLRVRLAGPPGNPDGVGAVIQSVLVPERGMQPSLGPARPLLAGSGFGSQDSVTLVLTTGGEAFSGIRVRWPGGRVTETAVPQGAREVLVDASGERVTKPNP